MKPQAAEPLSRQIFEPDTSRITAKLRQAAWPHTRIGWLLKSYFL
jgi:hypothetical protein